MPRAYTSTPAAFTPAAANTIWEIIAGANKPVRIKRVELSSANFSGTVVVVAQAEDITVTGTGTAQVPRPNDPNDSAAGATCKVNDTAEPTKGTQIWAVEWNIQVPYIWIAGPGEEWRANPGAGIGITLLTAPGAAIMVAVSFEED